MERVCRSSCSSSLTVSTGRPGKTWLSYTTESLSLWFCSVCHILLSVENMQSVAWFMLRWLLFMSSGVQLRGRLVFVTSSSSSAVGCQPAQSEARMQRRRRVLQCCPEYAATRQGPAVQTGQSLQLLCAVQLYPSPKFVPVCVIPQVKVNSGN